MLKVTEFFRKVKNVLLALAFIAGFCFAIYEGVKELFFK